MRREVNRQCGHKPRLGHTFLLLLTDGETLSLRNSDLKKFVILRVNDDIGLQLIAAIAKKGNPLIMMTFGARVGWT